MSPAINEVASKGLGVENAQSLGQAVRIAYSNAGYTFTTSSWFVDVKDRFRIFEFANQRYIAKRTHFDKAVDEVQQSRRAFTHMDGKNVEGKILRVVVPQIITAVDSDVVYVVSEYVGADLNEVSYGDAAPKLTAKQYVRIVQFLLENGIVHPGFLPRNLVERNDEIFLFDWEDVSFHHEGEAVDFDRLWYTNFVLNWSYLFPREELERHITAMLLSSQLSEPSLVRYEQTFRDILGLHDASLTDLRDSIERVVFGAELPVRVNMHESSLRPNDLGHLFADIFFDEMDVLADMASKVTRDYSEELYTAINGVISRMIQLCRDDNLKSLQYYATVAILLLLDPQAYTENEYKNLFEQKSLQAIVSSFEKNQHSLTAEFINGTLNQERVDTVLRTCVEAATGMSVASANRLAQISKYIMAMRGPAK